MGSKPIINGEIFRMNNNTDSPQILHNLCFPFLLGVRAVPREIENNAYAKLGGLGNKVHYGKCGGVV